MFTSTFDQADGVRRAKIGDTSAFLDLVKHFDRRIFHIAKLITQSDEDAEDVLIQTFLEAWSHLNDCQDNTKFYIWLATIGVNAALLKLLGNNWAGRAFLEDANGECVNMAPREMSKWQDNPQDRYTREELTHIPNQAMRSVEPIERAIFVLRDIEEMSTEDTAQALKLNVPAIKRGLLRARLQLREELAGRFEEPNDARAAEVGRVDA